MPGVSWGSGPKVELPFREFKANGTVPYAARKSAKTDMHYIQTV
jgi:hypothetical protein